MAYLWGTTPDRLRGGPAGVTVGEYRAMVELIHRRIRHQQGA